VRLFALIALFAASARADRLQLAACNGEAAEYEASYEGRVVLARAFLDPAHTEEESLREAARQQIRYVWGYIRTSPQLHAQMRFVLSAAAPRIELMPIEKTIYGRSLLLDWDGTDKRLEIPDIYTQRAVARGRVTAGDEAVAARFKARFDVAACGEPRADESSLTIPLPDDPWLFYWNVAPQDRRHFRYAGFDAQMSPCSDDDLAELAEPSVYWYDFWPDRTGVDLDGRAYDCRALLQAGRDFAPREVQLSRKARPSADFAALRAGLQGPISATVLLGVLDYHAGDLGLQALQQRIGAGSDPSKRALLQNPPDERGELFLLRFLSRIGEVLRPASYSSAVDGDYLTVRIHGSLRRSHRPIDLRASVGLTDIYGPRPPAHWRLLREALGRDAVIIYAGHSGIGENFRLGRIAQELQLQPAQLAAESARVPFQLIAFLSCYSYMYFGQDFPAGQPREYLFTGTEFSRGDLGALSTLDMLDHALAGDAASLRYFEPDDFVLLKEVK
jgi:hypothetical protein